MFVNWLVAWTYPYVFPLILKLPTKVFGVEGRYATALYSAAVKKNILDKTEKEMSAFEVSNRCSFV